MSYDPQLYALLHRGTPGDAAYYAARSKGARSVLELGCGFGRLLQPIAEVRGVERVVGLDIDDGLLSLAPEHPLVTTVQGDMRNFHLGEKFDRIYAPHGSMWCLTEEDGVRGCLRSVVRHLAPGGRFIFDAWAADEMHAVADPEDFDEDALEPVAKLQNTDGPIDVFERSTWDRATQRLDVTYLYVPTTGGQQREGTIRQRYLLTEQVDALLHEVGLTEVEKFGDFDGQPYAGDDDLLVVAATA